MKRTVDKTQILVVQTEEVVRASICNLLQRHGYSTEQAVSVKAARKNFILEHFDLIISGLRLPGDPGTEFITLARPVPVIIMTSYASLRSAVETMRQGAADYLSKPFDQDQLLASVKRSLAKAHPSNSRRQTRDNLLLGCSSKMLDIINKVQRAAPTFSPVLISGEIGSGRRTVAQNIHRASALAELPFETIHCASTTEEVLHYVLQDKNEKTVFFKNISELCKTKQALTLAAIDRQNIRIIASTENNLKTLSDFGQFRKDLFHSLNVIKIDIPPLREREQDIPLLVNYFLEQYAAEFGYSVKIEKEVVQMLNDYDWPGNISELQDAVYQAAIECEPGGTIGPQMLYKFEGSVHKSNQEDRYKKAINHKRSNLSLEEYFTHFVLHNQAHMTETMLAQKLGISRKSLWQRRCKLGIPREKQKPNESLG